MNPKRKQRLLLILLMLAGLSVAVALVLYSMRQNINLYYSPQQIAAGQAPHDRMMRVGGLVLHGSVKRDPESLKVSFTVTDTKAELKIHYQGILPDLFREGQGIVALGKLDANNEIQATEVLAKHDEKYMPPEVADAIKKATVNAPHAPKLPATGAEPKTPASGY